MNPKSLAMIFKIIPNIKQWVFADGKFQPKRAMWLFLFMCALGGMAYLIGPEQTAEVVDMLDDVSDIVGYVE